MKIEVTGEVRKMTSKAGNAMEIVQAYAHLATKKYPQEIEVLVPKGEKAWPAGMYELDYAASVSIGEYKALELRPVLKPLPSGK